MSGLENHMIDWVRSWFDSVGWFGVVIAMAIESACIPLPSEITMPLAGWLLVDEHHLGWSGVFLAGFWGAVGNLIGSLIAYFVGAYAGRPIIERWGKWVLLTPKDIDRADSFFVKWGEWAVFISRLLPVVRTFISIPAGIARMNLLRFSVLTFVGSFVWSTPLAAFGYKWGSDWEELRDKVRFLDYPIAALIVLAIAWFVWHRLKEMRAADEVAAS
ncbi:MAG TPA: DedA family protein [Thermomicrobiales bacterium]|nr:DedA family protein [Thermomicrobiales bacterium]